MAVLAHYFFLSLPSAIPAIFKNGSPLHFVFRWGHSKGYLKGWRSSIIISWFFSISAQLSSFPFISFTFHKPALLNVPFNDTFWFNVQGRRKKYRNNMVLIQENKKQTFYTGRSSLDSYLFLCLFSSCKGN